MILRPNKDLVEVFGYSPDDLTTQARTLWRIGGCPFTNKACTKSNHDGSIVYGTCSVTSPYGDCIICPNRLYEKNYWVLKRVAEDAFGTDIDFMLYEDYIRNRFITTPCVVALGQNSGREVKIGTHLSMDWVLAKVHNGRLIKYTGVEVQSIDITGNYRDVWHSYSNLGSTTRFIPSSEHGMNWANVHKRLIPQLIRKGTIYSRSELVTSGLYFIVPDIVYRKFEDIIGDDISTVQDKGPDVISVYTYELSPPVTHGEQREIIPRRTIRFKLSDFSNRFISGPNLPSGRLLDDAVRRVLGL